MPRTSYALKTFGSSIALMLTATLLLSGSVLARTSPHSAVEPKRLPLFALQDTDPARASMQTLIRLDPATLQETGRLELGTFEGTARSAWSPSRNELAIYGGGVVNLVDPARMRVRAKVPIGGDPRAALRAEALTWTNKRRVILLMSARRSGYGTVNVIDPDRRRVTKVFRTGLRKVPNDISSGTGPPVSRVRSGIASLTNSGFGGRYALMTVTKNGFRERPITRLVPDLQSWRGHLKGELPPIAVELVANARADISSREGIPEHEIRTTHVAPNIWGSGGYGCGVTAVVSRGYRAILVARGVEYDYRGMPKDGVFNFLRCTTRYQFADPKSNLLRAGQNARHVTWAALGVDVGRNRATIFAPGGVVVQLPLGRGPATFTSLLDIPPGAEIDVVSHGGGNVALRWERFKPGSSPGHWEGEVLHVNTRTWLVRRLLPFGCRVVTGKDVFLTSSSALPPYYTYCTGVAAYDMAGEPRFSLFPGRYLASLVTDGPYAYARLANEPGESGPLRVTVIELSTGKVVTRAQVPGELLAELNAHRY